LGDRSLVSFEEDGLDYVIARSVVVYNRHLAEGRRVGLYLEDNNADRRECAEAEDIGQDQVVPEVKDISRADSTIINIPSDVLFRPVTQLARSNTRADSLSFCVQSHVPVYNLAQGKSIATALVLGRPRPMVGSPPLELKLGYSPMSPTDTRKIHILGWEAPPNVLIVDDDPISRKLVTKFLQLFGCLIDVAVDGVGAVRQMMDQKTRKRKSSGVNGRRNAETEWRICNVSHPPI